MNIIDLQDKLKNLSQQQLIQEMQMPTGQMPQFLVLSELTRRKKMEDSFAIEQGRDQSTVAQDAVSAAGMPAEFARQMAGAMAPQTDMVGNTGAMPRQSAMPPQRMAGGGIVALQDGGGPIRAPRLVVRNGRQMLEMPDGSLVSLSRSQLAGLDRELDPTPPAPTVNLSDMAGPSISDVLDVTVPQSDQRAVQAQPSRAQVGMPDLRPVSAPPVTFADIADMGAPESISGLPPVPGSDSLVVGRETPALQPALADIGANVTPSRLSPNRMMETADARDSRAAIAAYAPSLFGPVPTGEGQMFDPFNSPFLPTTPVAGPNAPMAGTDLRGLGTIIAETLSGVDPKATADRLLESGQINQEQYNRYIFGSSGERNRIVREALGYAEPRVAPPVVAPPATDTALDPERRAPVVPGQTTGAPLEMPAGGAEELLPPTVDPAPPGPPRTPSGGGIAGIAAQGAGIAAQGAGAPSDYEQEMLNMLQSREKRATQDKWLALAQAGLSLMSSKNPTFGGALGEAGATGLGALREGQSTAEADRVALLGQIEQSRMGRAKLDLERQALAARSAAAGRDKGIPATVITPLFNQLEQAQERLASLGSPPEPGFFFDSPDHRVTERLRAAQDVQRAQNQINAAYAQYGLQPFGDGSTYDARD
jgi:hypothetical protein